MDFLVTIGRLWACLQEKTNGLVNSKKNDGFVAGRTVMMRVHGLALHIAQEWIAKLVFQ